MKLNIDTQLIEHMMEPKNYGSMGDPDSEGIGKNPANGEKVIIYLRVDDTNSSPRITDIRFQAIGCSTTIVAGSMLTEEAKGLDFVEVESLIVATNKVLESVPPEDAVCTEMVTLALQASIETYRNRQKSLDYPAITLYVENDCTPREGTAQL